MGARRHAGAPTRAGSDVAAQAQLAHEALRTQFGGAQFVTGLVARVELATGDVTIVNAGHPRPLRLRERPLVATSKGGRAVVVGTSGR